MNFLDIITLSFAGYFIAIGLYKGLIKQVLSLVGIIAAFTMCIIFGANATNFVQPFWDSQWTEAVSYLILFALTLLIFKLLAKALTRFSKAVALNTMNRILGGAFGALKALILCLMVYFLYQYTIAIAGTKPHTITDDSVVYQFVSKSYQQYFEGFMPS